MAFWIILGIIIAFIIGFIVGLIITCFAKISKEADLHIILLQIMEELKGDRKSAKMKMKGNTKTGQDMNYGRYIQANKTIELIKKLYGGIFQ